ncbi:MAG: zinc-ribbon domain-containing protein [Eubacteriales bacterium]|nr:zinc-ribbon domain-containing protein [Eubacteriales bacterium]
MRKSLYDYCMEYNREDLLRQWHPSKNGDLTPRKVTYGSQKKIWWRCEKGHEWPAAVYTRTTGTGCPYCSGRKPCLGENDLASQRPDLVAQWHPTKNNGVTPADVSLGSHHRAWWVCEKGHEWQAVVKSRTSGTGCPVCTNRRLLPGENDLATTHPDLAGQWHPIKNGDLTPRDLVAGSWKKIWWRCEKGHEWRAAVASRASSGVGCPVCAGRLVVPGDNDLATHFPAVAAQWHPTRNGTLTPDSIAPSSNRKVWWICDLGHAYAASVSARTIHSSGCPYCAGRKVLVGFNDLATLEPKVAAQWHPTLNGTLTPQMVTVGSHKKVWWECAEGHVWKAVVHSRAGARKCGCPVCAGRVKPDRQQRYAMAMAAQSQRTAADFAGKQNF